MGTVDTFPEESPLVFDISLEEDIESELEDFVLLTRLGILDEAKELFHMVLKEHQHLFPVFAETAAFFVDSNEGDQLTILLQDLKSRGTKFDTPDKNELLSILCDFATADPRVIETNSNDYLNQWLRHLNDHFFRRDQYTNILSPISSAQVYLPQ